MTLLITILAAVICTLVWYTKKECRDLKIGVLCLMFWGASLMWMADAVFEFLELRAEYFSPSAGDMLNDAFLGFCIVALALTVWVGIILLLDPRGTVRSVIKK